MCYDVGMTTQIAIRDLRNDVSEVVRRAEAGEDFVVTVQGRPAARLVGVDPRPTTMPSSVLAVALSKVPVDPTWAAELRADQNETTDDVDDAWPV